MKITLILLLALLIASCAGEATNEQDLQFTLSPDKVAGVYTNQFPKGHVVTIELAEPYKTQLGNLTGNNIGKRLQVIFNGKVLTSAIIKARINSGMIGSQRLTAEEAETLTKELKDAP